MWSRTARQLWLQRSPLVLRKAADGAAVGTQRTPAAAAASSTPSPTLETLSHAVDQLREHTRRSQHTLQAQEDVVRHLQQELLLTTRRLAQLEATADGLRETLTEVHRAMGEVMLGQRNTDLLVQQMERRQLSDGSGVALGTAMDAGGERQAAAADGAATATPGNAAVAEQMAVLHARLDQLTTHIFAADRLGAVVDGMAASGIETSGVAASVLAGGATSNRLQLLQQLQRRHALGTFTDAAGVTRLASQVIRVHNVPLNMGAMEVRQLCVRHVCTNGDATELVSCMIHRSSAGVPTAAAAAGEAAGHTQGTAAPSRYRSREAEAKLATRSSSASGALPVPPPPTFTGPAPPPVLPRGSAVAPIHPNTKTFEVVFASAAVAVRALHALNGLRLRPTVQDTPLSLAAEPVVSADVLAALKEWEDGSVTAAVGTATNATEAQ
ncbi:RNA-binding protein [Novymonas esmeraldas]|uniref:RNA-binding protein n=1 Tax=Novymonas esmeraldas TaxID=1808958 RepID=A0AAW0EV75_9TRYP